MDFPWSPSKKNLWKIRSFNGFRGEMEYRRVIFASSSLCSNFSFLSVSNILSLTMYFLKKCTCTMEFILSSYNPCDPFFTGEISWFKKLSIDSNLTLFCPLLQLCSSESLYNIKFSATFFEYMYLTYRLSETIR